MLATALILITTACGARSPTLVAKCLKGKGLIATNGTIIVSKEFRPIVPKDLAKKLGLGDTSLPRRVSWVSVASGANEVLATNEAVIFFTDNVAVIDLLQAGPGQIKTQLPPLPQNIEIANQDSHLQVVWYEHPGHDQTKVVEGCLR
jgi:hypothetical protein